MSKTFDVIVIGSGAAGMIAAIRAARDSKSVLLLEQLDTLGAKLKATGGGKCNLSNTLTNEEFMNCFGRNGRFMTTALNIFDYKSLISFLTNIGVSTHIPDGFRIFPITHNSSTIISALSNELNRLNVEIKTSCKVEKLLVDDNSVLGVKTSLGDFISSNVIVATGGLGYSKLGASGDGYEFAKLTGHKVTNLYAAMLPLITKEKWVEFCTADTIAKAIIKIDLPKAKKLKACGDLIFTKQGIRGPVVLDFAREITPFIESNKEVPLLINMVNGMNENEIFLHFKNKLNENLTVLQMVNTLLPLSVSQQICKICEINENEGYNKLAGDKKEKLVKILCQTPLTVIDHVGFEKAMITRGGISLKQINPNTMQSKLINGLYFCGEVVDLDGPCGGYNLQWSFSSGHLAGMLKS